MVKTILPPKSKAIGPYSQGVKIKPGTLVFISGQVAEDEKGNVVGKGDIHAQAKQVMENLKGMVEAAGGSLNDIVKLTILLTDMKYYDVVAKARYEYFKRDFPAATLFEVKSLAKKDWLLEIEAIAVIPE